MQHGRTDSAVWIWTLAACNGIAAAILHLWLTSQPVASVIGTFQTVATLAHFSTLAGLLGVLPWIVCRARAPRPLAVAFAVLVFGAFLLAVVVNAMVYALYKFHLNTMVWFMLTQGAALQTLGFSARTWTSTTLVVGAVVIAEWTLAAWLARSPPVRGRALLRYAALVLGAGIATQLVTAYADATAQRDLLMAVRTVPWAQPLTAKKFLARFGLEAKERDDPTLESTSPRTFNYPLAPLECDRRARPNILVLVIDSLRFDVLTDDVMPHVFAWSRSAVRFERHYSTGNGTRFGIFGLMYGLPGAYWHAALAERRGPVLIDELDARGYQFFVFGSAPLDSPEFHRTAFTQIWDRVAPGGPGGVVERDRAVTQGMIDAIRGRDPNRPFFGFLFLDAPHAYVYPRDVTPPFSPTLDSVDYLALDNHYDPRPFFNLYKTSIWFDDALVGRVLDAVSDDPALADTIVLVTGDHGQAFNEAHDNTWGHNSAFSDYQVRVPFVVRWPGRSPQRIERLTSHADWAPTLLTDALGCATPIDRYATGERLFDPTGASRVLPLEQWTQRALRTDDRVYVFLSWGGSEVRDSAYRLVDEPLDAQAVQRGFADLSRFTRH